MPLQIIKGDITKFECDAIVNPTNESLFPGRGVDYSIHRQAGKELFEMCMTLGGLEVGQAKITPAYNLPCKCVIHTVGPKWRGGEAKEELYLKACYYECLQIAKGAKFESIAFPLISAGTYNYPKDQVLKVALSVIKKFLNENEMTIYIVIYDKDEFSLSEGLKRDVSMYIRRMYVDPFACTCMSSSYFESGKMKSEKPLPRSHWRAQTVPDFEDIEDIQKVMYKGFASTLFDFIRKKELDEVACYKKANVSRQTWHKITTDNTYTPKKTTVIALAIALELNIEETQELLATTGYILSKSSLFDVVIMYCIVKKIYDVYEIDSILFKFDQETLFSKE